MAPISASGTYQARPLNQRAPPTATIHVDTRVPCDPISVLRRQRIAERLHRLGPRAIFHVLEEIDGIAWEIAARYADGLVPEILTALGGDRFPPAPLLVVPGDV